MQEEYKKLAKYYDILYESKGYEKESKFIIAILKKYNVRSVLDVGCGTGNHLIFLKKEGFDCEGLDLNQEMLNIAKQKLDVPLYKGDLTDFNINKKFDAIICMFATFNHLIESDSANKAMSNFYNHLNPNGILLIDLHNPQNNGSKVDNFGGINRVMSWSYDKSSKTEKTKIKFNVPEGIINDEHILRIYPIEEIKRLLVKADFSKIEAYENYTFNQATKLSKNIEILGIKLKGGHKK